MVRILTFLIVFYDLRFIDWFRVPGSELNHESVKLWQGRGNRPSRVLCCSNKNRSGKFSGPRSMVTYVPARSVKRSPALPLREDLFRNRQWGVRLWAIIEKMGVFMGMSLKVCKCLPHSPIHPPTARTYCLP